MTCAPTHAMILAAGLGTRMRPLTNDRPKPLIKVADKTLIEHAMGRLTAVGVTDIVVNVHYRAEMLETYLKNRPKKPKIHISNEVGLLLDTGGGIRKALPMLGNKPFFTHNSDSLWTEGMGSNLARMAEHWEDGEMDVLMLLAPMVKSSGYDGKGDFVMDKLGRLTRRNQRQMAPFVWTGVQIIHPRVFEDTPDGPFSTNMIWDRAIDAGRLFGIQMDGFWMHVGTPCGLKLANERLRHMYLRVA